MRVAALAQTDRCIQRWPTQRAREWVDGFLRRARKDTNTLAVVVVGSAVRKDVASEDLDLIVVCTNPRSFRERAPLEVDLRAFGTADVDAKIEEGNDLLGWAVMYGRPILDRDGTWHRIVKRWSGHVPLPDPAVAGARAKRIRKRMMEMRKMGDDEAAVELEVSYLTHCARGTLAKAGVYAASRPELPDQLRLVGKQRLADRVANALEARARLRAGVVPGSTQLASAT